MNKTMTTSNGMESSLSLESKASAASTASPSKQMIVFNSLRNLNDVFEFAKNDLNSKYLSDNICRNFSSKQKRVKLKKMMEEVVVMQRESGRLDNSSQTNDCFFENTRTDGSASFQNMNVVQNKKTLMDLLTSPSNMQKQNYILPSFKSTEDYCLNDFSLEKPTLKRVQLDPIEPEMHQGLLRINNANASQHDNTTAKKLNDIIDLIRLNDQSEVNNSSNPKPILNLKLNPKEAIKINEFSNQKSLITKLDEKEQVLSNKMNRNMELLQNCLTANHYEANLTNDKHSMINVNTSALNFENLAQTAASNSSSYSDTACTEVKTRKKLNLYTIGNFIPINKKTNESSLTNEDMEIISRSRSAKAANENNSTKKHMKRLENFRPFICSWCQISFKTKSNLQKHMKTQSHFKKCIELGIKINTDGGHDEASSEYLDTEHEYVQLEMDKTN